MRPLVAVRRAVPFDAHFLDRSELFWPLARAAKALGGHGDFPPIEAFAKMFEGEPRVRFVEAPPRRRRGAPIDTRSLYDARIAIDREVPTRARCWHDLMNALVWATFPRAKHALHTRQHRAITERLAPDARALPPARTPELDALALLDEGGVVVLSVDPYDDRAAGARGAIVFGHAIYESLVLGVAPAVVAAIELTLPSGPSSSELEVVRAVDESLARLIEDETMLRAPSQLRRVRITTDALEQTRGRSLHTVEEPM
jgi:hypothetical protein